MLWFFKLVALISDKDEMEARTGKSHTHNHWQEIIVSYFYVKRRPALRIAKSIRLSKQVFLYVCMCVGM